MAPARRSARAVGRTPAAAACRAVAAVAAARSGACAALVAALLLPAACTYSPHPQDGKLACGPGNSCPDGFQCLPLAGILRCWDKNGPGPSGRDGSASVDGQRPGFEGGLPLFDGGLPLSDGGSPSDRGGPASDRGLTPMDRPPPVDGGGAGSGGRPVDGGGGGTGGTGGVSPAVRNQYIGTWTYGANATVVTDCGPDLPVNEESLTGSTFDVKAGPAGYSDLYAEAGCPLYLDIAADGTYLVYADDASCRITQNGLEYSWVTYDFFFFTGDGRNGLVTTAEYLVTIYDPVSAASVDCWQTIDSAVISKSATAAALSGDDTAAPDRSLTRAFDTRFIRDDPPRP